MTTKALPQDPGNLTHRRPSSLHVRVRVHMPEPAATSDRLMMRRPTGNGPRDQGEGIGEGAERGLGPLCRIRQNGETGDWSGELAYEAARTARARRCRVARGPARSRSTTPKAKRECRKGNPWVGARVW